MLSALMCMNCLLVIWVSVFGELVGLGLSGKVVVGRWREYLRYCKKKMVSYCKQEIVCMD